MVINANIRPNDDLIEYLEQHFEQFTLTQKKLVNYLVSNPHEAAFLTIDELSQKINAVPSTVTRFSKEIGLSGFTEIRKRLKKIVIDKVDTVNQGRGQLDKAKLMQIDDKENVIKNSLLKDLSNLEKLIMMENETEIKKFVDILLSAKNKYIIASRGSFPLGYFFYFQINKILPDVNFLTNFDGNLFNEIRKIGEKDVVVAISFPRYTKTTIDFSYLSRQNGADIISISDSKISPLYKLSTVALFCPCESEVFFDSLVAGFALLNTILSVLFYKNYDTTIQNLNEEEWIIRQLVI